MMDEDIEEIIGVNGRRIQEALEELRRVEINKKVDELRTKLPRQGRCPICTLRLPCKHYSTVSQLPRTSIIEPTPIAPPKTNFNITDYLPKLTPESHKRGFSVKYRGQQTSYNFDFNRRHTSLPNEKRLKELEVIESYREEKIRKEISKIASLKEQEELQQRQQELIEKRRRKYLERQKEKLREYQGGLEERKRVVRELFEAGEEIKRVEDERRRRYLEEQRQKVAEYNEKKRVLKEISRQKVEDLQENVIGYKPIRVKRM